MDPRPVPELSPAMVPPPGVRALLFDCDGTLLDTLGVYKRAWTGPFAARGFTITDEWFYANAGMAMTPFILEALPDASQEEQDAIEAEGMQSYFAELHLVEVLDHVADVARAHHGLIPLAVVSSGRRDHVERSLVAAGIRDLFDLVITLDDVENAKPAADCYLLALERLGLEPHEAVAYEDSTSGLEAARAAGLRAIDVRLS